jgi:hypothetical protein
MPPSTSEERVAENRERTHPNMIVFATGDKSVRLGGEPLVGGWTSLLELYWLEVAR